MSIFWKYFLYRLSLLFVVRCFFRRLNWGYFLLCCSLFFPHSISFHLKQMTIMLVVRICFVSFLFPKDDSFQSGSTYTLFHKWTHASRAHIIYTFNRYFFCVCHITMQQSLFHTQNYTRSRASWFSFELFTFAKVLFGPNWLSAVCVCVSILVANEPVRSRQLGLQIGILLHNQTTTI